MGATTSGHVGPIAFGARCVVLPPWIDGAVYTLFFYYAWGVFAILFIARHLGMGLMEVGGATNTRIMLQMVVFTLAFTCTWVRFICLNLLPHGSSKFVKFCVLIADYISYGLVGFTNSCVWFSLTRKAPYQEEELLRSESAHETLPTEAFSTIVTEMAESRTASA
jgi:hypothetical protein